MATTVKANTLTLQNAVSKYVMREQFCDVTLVSDDFHQFPAHKIVLSAFSPILEKLLISSNQKNDQTVLYLRGFNSLDLQTMLRFMYGGEVLTENIDEGFKQLSSNLIILGISDTSKNPSECSKVPEKQNLENLKNNYKVFNKSDLSIEILEEEQKDSTVDDDTVNAALDLRTNQKVTEDTSDPKDAEEVPVVASRRPPANYFKLIEGVESTFECLFCEEKCPSKTILRRHNRTVHLNIENYECKVCQKKFEKLYNLDNHFHSYHREHDVQCSKCDLTAGSKQIIYQHYVKEHIDILFKCKECSFETHTENLLKSHVKIVHEKNTNKINCDQCGQLMSRNYLREHTEMKHSGKRFPCSTCPFQATSRQYLKIHEKSQHTGVVEKCEQCDFKTKFIGNLKMHIEVNHAGLRFTCEYCEQIFRSKTQMKRHQILKHNVSHVFRNYNNQ